MMRDLYKRAVKINDPSRIMFISNKVRLVPASEADKERRYFCLACTNDHREDIPYFKAIKAQMLAGGLEAMCDGMG